MICILKIEQKIIIIRKQNDLIETKGFNSYKFLVDYIKVNVYLLRFHFLTHHTYAINIIFLYRFTTVYFNKCRRIYMCLKLNKSY